MARGELSWIPRTLNRPTHLGLPLNTHCINTNSSGSRGRGSWALDDPPPPHLAHDVGFLTLAHDVGFLTLAHDVGFLTLAHDVGFLTLSPKLDPSSLRGDLISWTPPTNHVRREYNNTVLSENTKTEILLENTQRNN